MNVKFAVAAFVTGVVSAGLTMIIALLFALSRTDHIGPAFIVIPLFVFIYVTIGWVFFRHLHRIVRTTHAHVTDLSEKIYEQVLKIVLTSWTGLAVGWAIVSLSQTHFPSEMDLSGPVGRLVLVGVVVALGSGLYLVATSYRHVLAEKFNDVISESDLKFQRQPSASIRWLILGIVVIALVLPVDVSPFYITDIDHWMASFTRLIGPVLVPKSGPWKRIGEVLAESSDRLWRFSGASSDQIHEMTPMSPLVIFIQIALLTFAAIVIARFFSSRRKRKYVDQRKSAGHVPWGIGWLLREVKGMVIKWLKRFGFLVDRATTPQARDVKGKRGSLRGSSDSTVGESIESLYAGVVQRLGTMGLVRKSSETPYEYLTRWESFAIGKDESHGFSLLTEMYVEKRYVGRKSDDPNALISRARAAGLRAVRRFRATSIVRRIRSKIKDDRS